MRATVKKTFHGEITGESSAELLMCNTDAYTAIERIVGQVGERSGSFVIQHGAVREDNVTSAFGVVVPGSGTGALRGLLGKTEIRHDEHGAILTLDYAFE